MDNCNYLIQGCSMKNFQGPIKIRYRILMQNLVPDKIVLDDISSN